MKTIGEITSWLKELLAQPINISLYLGLGKNAERVYLQANLGQAAANSICRQFVDGLTNYFKNEHLTTHPLSHLDARADTLYGYDLEDVPPEFSALNSIAAGETEPEFFTFEGRSISDVRSLVIKIKSANKSVTFFKQVFPVSIVKRDQILLTWKTDQFDILKEDVLKILPGFDVMLIGDDFYIANLQKFEKEFSFSQVTTKAAKAVTEKIQAMNLVADVKGHLADLNISARHILRAKNSPVLLIETEKIISFVVLHPAYKLKVENGKIQLTSKESIKGLFKLLNDDILKSELTNLNYDTLAKNMLDAAISADPA